MSTKWKNLEYNSLTEFSQAVTQYKELKKKKREYEKKIQELMDNISIPLWYFDQTGIQKITNSPLEFDIKKYYENNPEITNNATNILLAPEVFYCPEITSFIMDVPSNFFPEIQNPRLFETTLKYLFPLDKSITVTESDFDKSSIEYFEAYIFPYEKEKRFTMFLDSSIRVSNKLENILQNYFKNKGIKIEANGTFFPPGFHAEHRFITQPKAFYLDKFKIFNENESKETEEGLSIIDDKQGFQQKFLRININNKMGEYTMCVPTNSKSFDKIKKLLNI